MESGNPNSQTVHEEEQKEPSPEPCEQNRRVDVLPEDLPAARVVDALDHFDGDEA